MFARWRTWARKLQTDALALYLACQDTRTPWYAKLLAAAVAAYALSPLDLIPDFIPILGYVDDLLLLPLGIALAAKLIPPVVLADCRRRAREMADRPTSRVGAVAIVALWIAVALSAGYYFVRTTTD